ncbi:MAG: hypothetical protein M0009_05615 [Deltaproteobacteria bacterium]|nr:hypothetical protein [Deltaproteobacteria bacterium]
MLKIVENELAIRRYERQLVRALKPLTSETITVKLGHPGKSEPAKVAWSSRLGIWFFSRKVEELRYWHAFGIGRPEGESTVTITCEINFPLCGIDRRTGGAFAEDGRGRVFVIHRGKLGGGRKGVGKFLFENRYRGVWEIVDDGGEQTPVAVVAVLGSPRFARQVVQFVRKIALLKEGAVERATAQTEMAFAEPAVHEEFIGDPFPAGALEIGAGCDRGLVIEDLSAALVRSGLQVGNDRQWDLAASDKKGTIRAVFRILDEMALTDLQAGAMQLLLNGLDLPGEPRLILLSPAAAEPALREKLKRLGIDFLEYGWREDRAVFPELNPLLQQIPS